MSEQTEVSTASPDGSQPNQADPFLVVKIGYIKWMEQVTNTRVESEEAVKVAYVTAHNAIVGGIAEIRKIHPDVDRFLVLMARLSTVWFVNFTEVGMSTYLEGLYIMAKHSEFMRPLRQQQKSRIIIPGQ